VRPILTRTNPHLVEPSRSLDDKAYLFFYPLGERGQWKGMSRFQGGQRVAEFSDARINPRALLESSFLAMRLRLSRLRATLLGKRSRSEPLGFNPLDRDLLYERVIAVGGAAANPTIISLMANVMGAPVYTITSGGQPRVPSSARGAGNKAAWCLDRATRGDRMTGSFETFLANSRSTTDRPPELSFLTDADEHEFELFGALVPEYCRLEQAIQKGHI